MPFPQATSRTLREPILASLRDAGFGGLLRKFTASQPWIRKTCQKLQLSFRAATSAAQKLPDNFEEVKGLFIKQVCWCGYSYLDHGC